MATPRVYHRATMQPGRDTVLDGTAGHHLARVLRVRVGDPVTVFGGAGGEFHTTVKLIDRGGVRVHCERFDPIEREAPIAIGLAQVVSAGERMEVTVQKAVELGAAFIQPLTARRAKVRLSEERAERRVGHWQRIAEAACEQCGRNTVPIVRDLMDYPDWLAGYSDTATRLLLVPAGARRLSELTGIGERVTVLVGAESGFAEEEIEMAFACGFTAVRLGPRILRTETAGLAALAALQARWGDF